MTRVRARSGATVRRPRSAASVRKCAALTLPTLIPPPLSPPPLSPPPLSPPPLSPPPLSPPPLSPPPLSPPPLSPPPLSPPPLSPPPPCHAAVTANPPPLFSSGHPSMFRRG